MTSSELPIEPNELRSDLIRLVDRRSPRRWTLIDAISGSISRLTCRDLSLLENGAHANKASLRIDELIAQAKAAGLLRQRVASRRSWASWPMLALAFRVPVVSIDRVAHWLARHSTLLFSPAAIATWSLAIMIALLSILVGWSRAERSIAMVYGATGSASTIGYSLAVLFVATKCVHELGHATACRRLGVPVGDIGLFFFCGVPCPYCDVSQVWRLDSPLRRAAVMIAGIYVELVLATIATVVWWLTSDGPLHVIAMNTILLCGLSTVVFNANPLMRMDGYYVLSDLLGTPNLRRQAALAWRGLITSRVAGAISGRANIGLASGLLSLYHLASTAYRVMISCFIGMFLVALFADWNLWWIGFASFVGIALAAIFRLTVSWLSVFKGQGIWRESGMFRRMLVCFGLATLLVIVAFIPLRREVAATGILDVADAAEIFVPESGWVDRVNCDIGDRVAAGDPLALLRDDDLNIQVVAWKTRSTIAALESANLKRQALRESGNDLAWKVDLANRELVEAQYNGIVNRQQRLKLVAPVAGTILPPADWYSASPGNEPGNEPREFKSLLDLEGRFVTMRTRWCRVGDPSKTCISLLVSAEQRQQIKSGFAAVVLMDDGEIKRLVFHVDEINELERRESPSPDTVCYLVKCRLPVQQSAESVYGPIGTKVEARICVGYEPVWTWLHRSINEAFGG